MDLYLIKAFWVKNKSYINKLIILLVSIITFFALFSLSPQWCLSKYNIWKAEELDMTIFVSEVYQTKIYDCFNLFDADEYNRYFSGEMQVDDHIEKISFRCEEQFDWIIFGNVANEQENNVDDWFVVGEFKTVFNSKKLVLNIQDVYGELFPKEIDKLTFRPLSSC